jgi:hypothetical protein
MRYWAWKRQRQKRAALALQHHGPFSLRQGDRRSRLCVHWQYACAAWEWLMNPGLRKTSQWDVWWVGWIFFIDNVTVWYDSVWIRYLSGIVTVVFWYYTVDTSLISGCNFFYFFEAIFINPRESRQPPLRVRVWRGFRIAYPDPYPAVPYPKPAGVWKPVIIPIYDSMKIENSNRDIYRLPETLKSIWR